MILDQHHEDLVNGVYHEFKQIFDSSEQGMYVYLDDAHKICNKKFATMLGYSSPEKWAAVNQSFPDTFVESKSQDTLSSTYQNIIEKKVSSTIDVTWKKKSGETINTTVIMVPVMYKGHLFALHFISEKKPNDANRNQQTSFLKQGGV
jgi:PAS domain S-box-containing protein